MEHTYHICDRSMSIADADIISMGCYSLAKWLMALVIRATRLIRQDHDAKCYLIKLYCGCCLQSMNHF